MTLLSSDEHVVQVDYRLIEALQEREHQLAQSQRLAHIGSWEYEIATDTVTWSDELYRIFGVETGELKPTMVGVLDRVHPDDSAEMLRVAARAMDTCTPWTFRHRLVRPGGEVRHVECRGEVVTDVAGVPIRTHGTLRDLTDSLLGEQHLHDVSTAFELVRVAAGTVHGAPDVEDALRCSVEIICRAQRWPVGRVWRVGRGGRDLVPTGLTSDASAGQWPSPSELTLQAVRHRQPRPRPPVEHGRDAPLDDPASGAAVFAAPVAVGDDVVYVLEFEGEHRVGCDQLLIGAISSVCSTIGQRIEQDRVRLLERRDSRFATLVKYAHEAIVVLGADGTILYSTPAAARLFGYAHGSRIGTSVYDIIHDDDRESVRRRFDTNGAQRPRTDVVELTIADGDGSWRRVEVTRTDIADDPRIEGALIVNIRDVTERPQAIGSVNEAGPNDPLTGLSTRHMFLDQVQRALSLERRTGWTTVVLSIDVDHFHRVNDEHGHDGGDHVLITVADRLRASLREHDTMARGAPAITRVGGDEFLVMCENVPDDIAAHDIATRLLDAIAEPIQIGAVQVAVTASIGISISATESVPQQMILDAEAAHRHARALGGAQHQFFTAERHHRAAAASALVDALHDALVADEFRLVYQPKISLATNRIVGVEALIRWEHPERGLIMPNDFIPAAESSGLIVPIGAWVLKEALRQGAVWQQAYPRTPLRLAVNVSARQFRAGLASSIREAIGGASIDATAVCLEMTETTVMENIDDTVTVLHELKQLGFTLSIDDFGTGYSSLEYLHRMPIDEIKIDRSFVAGLGTDTVNTAIVASVISLAHAMHLDVVAEGVETLDQLEHLRALGCDYAQGYLIARPMPPADIDSYLAADATGQQLPRPDPTSGVARPAAPETVLIVDDTTDVRMLAKMSLTAAGFTVEEAADGAAALALARNLAPSCVLLDVSMPDMSGIDVCRALRSEPATAHCTIVMLTTHANANDKAEAFLAGADDYIVKPFAPRDLVTRVRSALHRRHTAIATIDRSATAAASMPALPDPQSAPRLRPDKGDRR